MSTPSPLAIAKLAQKRQVAALQPEVKAKVDGPRVHDGIVKTKHLTPGMKVRPLAKINGTWQPASSEREVAMAYKATEDGSHWRVQWSSQHPNQDYAAGKRWYCEALDGQPIKAQRREHPAHLTTNLGEVLAAAQASA